MIDGVPSLSYHVISNRISTPGYQYDSAGNLTRGQAENGVWQRYQYDAANRLVAVMNDSSVIIGTNSYGTDNQRLKSVENGVARWYGWDGGQSIVEYSDNGTNLVWAKSYVYLGGRLLLTDEPVTGRQYHHADRLGTRIVTNASGAKVSEQATLPFGTALGSPETTGTPSNRRFTSYERSAATKLDYAVNRSYASWQGRFTQIDPLGMGAVSVGNPQSLNLYGYVQNDPVNFIDPTGLNRIDARLRCDYTVCSTSIDGKKSCETHCTWVITIYEDGYGGGNRGSLPTGLFDSAGTGGGDWFSYLFGVDFDNVDWSRALPCLADAAINLGIGAGLASLGPLGALASFALDMTGTDINIAQAVREFIGYGGKGFTNPVNPFGETDLAAGGAAIANDVAQTAHGGANNAANRAERIANQSKRSVARSEAKNAAAKSLGRLGKAAKFLPWVAAGLAAVDFAVEGHGCIAKNAK